MGTKCALYTAEELEKKLEETYKELKDHCEACEALKKYYAAVCEAANEIVENDRTEEL